MIGGLHGRIYSPKGTRRNTGGFTIVEALIVLAVSGTLLASAVLLVNGKQRITAYNQAIHDVQSQLQQVVNDVGSGFYPNDGNLRCAAGGPGGGPLLTGGSTEQGANKDCIFIGKVIQFGVSGTDPEEFNVYTLVGLTGDSSNPSLNLSSTKARLIAKTSSDTSIPDAFDTNSLHYGMTVSRRYYQDNPAREVSAVGFSSNLNSLAEEDNSQQVNVIAIPGAGLDKDGPTAVTDINGALATATLNPSNGVWVCFNSGGTDQSGLISIGANGRQGLVSLKTYNRLDCR